MRCIALLFLLWASAQADTLILRNGTRVKGRWWAADAEVINFLVDGRRLERYPRADVVEVVFGDEQAANRAAAPPVAAPTLRERVSGNTYSFAPVDVPGSGEYSFSPANSNDRYCFGID